jgi:hypothetical protein
VIQTFRLAALVGFECITCNELATCASLQPIGESAVQQVETTVVMLEAARTVELRRGLVLPPGLYSGTETYTHLVGSGRDRTASQFKIKLTARQLADMGAEVPTNLISETIDVTKFVRLGQLIVC